MVGTQVSIVQARRVRGTRGIRLGNLGFANISQQITVQDMANAVPPAPSFQMPLAAQPGGSRRIQDLLFSSPAPQASSQVIDTSGEVVSETSAPLPNAEGGDQVGAGYVVSDLSPAVVPTRAAWKTWLPIGLVVAGIAGAVFILRK